MSNGEYQRAFSEWKELAQDARKRGEELDKSVHEQGWRLAASVGIPRCSCSLHNASIDDELKGWCSGNPDMLKTAKKAAWLLNQWDGSRQADKIVKSAWNRLLAKPFGMAEYNVD